jgi:hypothetical protein
MRPHVVAFASFLVACGGGAPPAQAPSADTSSLENGGPSKEAPEPASSAAAPSSAPASAPATASSAAATSDEAPAAAFHPAPSVTGAIDGKSFTPKVAQVLSPMKKDGRIQLTLTEATECPSAGDKGDHPALTLVMPWSDGYKVDLAALKVGGKKGPGEIAFTRSKKDAPATFKPSGTAQVVSAPMEKGGKGKLKIDLQSGGYMLAGDLDIEICVAPK